MLPDLTWPFRNLILKLRNLTRPFRNAHDLLFKPVDLILDLILSTFFLQSFPFGKTTKGKVRKKCIEHGEYCLSHLIQRPGNSSSQSPKHLHTRTHYNYNNSSNVTYSGNINTTNSNTTNFMGATPFWATQNADPFGFQQQQQYQNPGYGGTPSDLSSSSIHIQDTDFRSVLRSSSSSSNDNDNDNDNDNESQRDILPATAAAQIPTNVGARLHTA